MMRTSGLGAFATILLLASTSCADDMMIERTQRHTAAIRSYRGVLVEKGVIDAGELRSEVMFKRPSLFVSRALAPEPFAGVSLSYNGRQLVLYYPKINYAISFENLTPPTLDDERQLIAYAYRHNNETFRYEIGEGAEVARLPTVTLEYRAKKKGALHPAGTVQVYDKYSFLAAGNLRFAGDVRYAFRFEELQFNLMLADGLFDLAVPKNAIVSRWVMDQAGIPETELRASANFDVQLPRPPDFVLDRIVRQDGPVPAFTVVYRRGPHFVLLSMWRDTGLRATASEHGVPITSGNKHGRLVISPFLSTFSFGQGGTMYVLTSNLPFDELVAMAETM